jgi:hypothetical protein
VNHDFLDFYFFGIGFALICRMFKRLMRLVPSKSRFLRFIVLLGLLVTCMVGTGCATVEPVIRFSPRFAPEQIVWVGGVPVVSRQGANSRVAMAFAREQDGKVGFRVEVENRTDQSIILDSSAFTYTTCERTTGAKEETCSLRNPVLDPEKILIDMELQRAREKASHANSQGFWTAMILLNATLAIAGAAQGDSRPMDGLDYAVDRAEFEQTNERLQASGHEMQKINWETMAFRKSTVMPHRAVAGLVFIDKSPKASAISLYAIIAGEMYIFTFDQTVIQAAPRSTDTIPPRLR